MPVTAQSLGGLKTDVVRSGEEIGRRALALGAAVAISFDADRDEIVAWLAESGIEHNLTDRERRFVSSTTPDRKDLTKFSWRSEALTVLLWAIGKLAELPGANEQCDTGPLEDVLPPYGDQTAQEFLASAVARPSDVLLSKALELQDQHALARARDRDPNYKAHAPAVDIEIIQERHHAINWVVGYCGQEWESVTTDT